MIGLTRRRQTPTPPPLAPSLVRPPRTLALAGAVLQGAAALCSSAPRASFGGACRAGGRSASAPALSWRRARPTRGRRRTPAGAPRLPLRVLRGQSGLRARMHRLSGAARGGGGGASGRAAAWGQREGAGECRTSRGRIPWLRSFRAIGRAGAGNAVWKVDEGVMARRRPGVLGALSARCYLRENLQMRCWKQVNLGTIGVMEGVIRREEDFEVR